MTRRCEETVRFDGAVLAQLLGPALCECGATFDTWHARCRFAGGNGAADCPGARRIAAAYEAAGAAAAAAWRRALL